MNFSTDSRAMSSLYCSGGDFMKYDDAERTGPAMPRSLAIFAARTASMMTPAEFVEPRHVVRRADVHVGLGHLVRDLRGNRLGLRDLLGLQPLALQHVHEVHVSA